MLRDGRARFFGNVEVVGDGGGGWRAGGDDGRGESAADDDDDAAAASSSSSSSAAPPPSPSSSAPLPVRLQDLRGIYHAVVLAHGAESATPLGLPLLLPRRKKEGGGKGGKAGGGESTGELSTSSLPFSPSPASSSGVVTARDFILWANGHPELSALGLDLRNLRSAVVVGAGNVALDCARLLLRGQRELLERTDASRAALSAALALDSSSSSDDDEEEEEGEEENKEEKEKKDDSPPRRTVHVVARRGAAQAAFSAKELREALSLPGVSVFVHHPPPFLEGDGDELLDPADRAELAASRRAARVFDLLRKKAAEGEEEGVGWKKKKKELHFHFLRSPVELIAAEDDDDGASTSSPPRVAAVRLVANRLETRQGRDGKARRVAVAVAASDDGEGDKGDGDGGQGVPASSSPSSSPSSPSSTPTFLTLPAQLVIAALGFRTPSLGEGTPYDEERGVVPSGAGGRVLPSPLEGPAAALSSSPPSSSPSSSSPPSPARPLRGLYVTGWARRGPTGIIGENLRDAAEVADAVASDAAELMMTREGEKKDVSSSSSSSDLLSLLRLSSSSTSPRVVGVEGWARIDALEKEAAAREVEERRRSEKERRKTTTRKGGGDEEDGGGDSSSSAAIAPPRVKIWSAEELLRAAGV